MAQLRNLTLAGLNGDYRIRFRDIANFDNAFRVAGEGSVVVERSPNGTEYFVRASAAHWRVYLTLVTPSDFPTLFYWDDCTNYGWFQLDGFAQTDFAPGNFPYVTAAAAGSEKPTQLTATTTDADKLCVPGLDDKFILVR